MKAVLLWCFLFVSTGLFSQPLDEREEKLFVPVQTLVQSVPIPYSAIEVVDARFDRSTIGCIQGNRILAHFCFKTKAVFPDSFHRYLPQVLQSVVTLQPAAPDTLVVLVKRFRIADYSHHLTASVSTKMQLVLSFSATFFASHGGRLQRLFSVDNMDSRNVLYIRNTDEKKAKRRQFESKETRAFALASMLSDMLTQRAWNPTNGASYARSSLDTALLQRFALPVYKEATGVGTFATFESFKANQLVPRALRFHYAKDSTLLKVTDSANVKVDMKNVWGFSDGRHRYTVFRGELTKLVPSDHGFKVLSYRTGAELRGKTAYGDYAISGLVIIGALRKLGDEVEHGEYFDLNMDTGTFHIEELVGTATIPPELLKAK